MSQPPPLIALCARVLTFSDEGKRDAYSSSQPYSRAVARAGGVPVMVPPIHELAANALTVLQHFDGVLLPGGGDVDPRRYGQEPLDENLYGITEIHDELDWPPGYATSDLTKPYVSVRYGAYYMAKQRKLFGGDVPAMLAAYNGGPGNSLKWQKRGGGDPDAFLDVISFDETRAYVRAITQNLAMYGALYPPAG